jgi:Nif-specific regulatory protein
MASHRIPFEGLSAAERLRLIAENDRLRHELRDRHRLLDLAGDSRPVRQVRDQIAQVAPSRAHVLMLGEPGSGRSRTARAIHAASAHPDAPFVTVECGAMPDDDVEAQLFGAAGGGCVGRARGGTLFLHEVARLGRCAQERLASLAAARAGRDAGRGGTRGAKASADVRVLATGPSTLDAVVSDGAFRPELRDALGAVTIRVPALRDRKVDLPVLVDLFVEEFARRHVRRVSRVSGHAMDLLTHYDWPGNVAELSRAIERAVILTAGPVIHHHHLPDPVQKAGGSLAVPPVGLGEALDAYEKDLLEDALRRAHGVRSAAARMLLTSERILSYRLRKHGIDSRRFR